MSWPSPEALRARYEPRLRDELDTLRGASTATRADRRPVALDQQSVGRLSRQDALQGQAMASGIEARRQARVRAIEAALERFDSDEFGWCDECGEPIGEGRLDVDPTVVRCVGCAR